MKVEPHLPFTPLPLSLFSLSLPPPPSHFKLSSSPPSSITFPLSPSPLPFSSSFFHYILPHPSLSLALRFSQRNSHHFHQHYTRETKERSAMIKPTTTPAFVDEIDCGSFFDNIDDFIDFPSDDVPDPSPPFWPSPSLPPTDSVFSAPELSVPYEDIVQLEWLSNFVEDSFSGESLTINNKQDSSSLNNHSSHQNNFQTSSPVSVLESSSSCSGEKTAPHTPEVVASARRGRARSKRPRPATFTPRPPMQLISPTSSVNESRQPGVPSMVPSDSENFAESRLLIKIPMQIKSEQKKKKKIKFTVPSGPVEMDENSPPVQQAVRKCMHCEITKTPQWRAGPMGPKTLCNACGVRYKSGRLFPEYRPAASPTFVPSLHSNSHKKVLEMRTRVVRDNSLMDGAMMANLPELIPNNSNITMNYI